MTLDWLLLSLRVLAAVLLYAFVAVVAYAIWLDARAAAARAGRGTSDRGSSAVAGAQVVAPLCWLSVGAEDGHKRAVGHRFALVLPATLGREADNQVVLTDACVSARHAMIERAGDEWVLTDLGSRNGTHLNDLPITRPTMLADGDVIGIGSLRLTFETGHSDPVGVRPAT